MENKEPDKYYKNKYGKKFTLKWDLFAFGGGLAFMGLTKLVRGDNPSLTIEEKQKIEKIDSIYHVRYDSIDKVHRKTIDSLRNDYYKQRSKILD